MPADDDTRPLGRTGIHVLPLGIGTNKWRRADRAAVLETYRTVNDAGSCMIDTAEIYFCFTDAKNAEEFAGRFGGESLSPAEVSRQLGPVRRCQSCGNGELS